MSNVNAIGTLAQLVPPTRLPAPAAATQRIFSDSGGNQTITSNHFSRPQYQHASAIVLPIATPSNQKGQMTPKVIEATSPMTPPKSANSPTAIAHLPSPRPSPPSRPSRPSQAYSLSSQPSVPTVSNAPARPQPQTTGKATAPASTQGHQHHHHHHHHHHHRPHHRMHDTPHHARDNQHPSSVPNVDAVLPHGTLVRIVGNNRTKYELTGRKGVVATAQALGGWHEVQLLENDDTNTGEGKKLKDKKGKDWVVKVQRNALEVLKMGEGGIVQEGTNHNNSFPKKDRKEGEKVHSVIRKKKIARKVGELGSSSGKVRARIEKLNQSSLNKYKKYYNLQFASKEPSREELVWAVKRHFAKTKVNEREVINNFLKRIHKGVTLTAKVE